MATEEASRQESRISGWPLSWMVRDQLAGLEGYTGYTLFCDVLWTTTAGFSTLFLDTHNTCHTFRALSASGATDMAIELQKRTLYEVRADLGCSAAFDVVFHLTSTGSE